MSSESPTAPLETKEIVVIASGQKTVVKVPVPKAKEVVKQPESASEEGEPKEPVEPTPVQTLSRSVEQVFIACDNQIRALCEGKHNALYQQDLLIEKMIQQTPESLWLTRMSTKIEMCQACTDAEIACEHFPIDINKWGEMQTFNLLQKEVGQHYEKDTIADFAGMNPNKTGIRMLVLETLVRGAGVASTMRFYVYYMTEKNYHVQQTEHDRIYKGLTRAQPLKSHRSPEEIHVIHTAWGYVVFGQAVAVEKPTDEERVSMNEKRKKFTDAEEIYRERRDKIRHQALMDQSDTVIDYVLHLIAPQLIKRLDDAGKFLPDRLLLQVAVENNGTVINMDKTVMLEHKGLQMRCDELRRQHLLHKRMLEILKKYKEDGLDTEARRQIEEIVAAAVPEPSADVKAELDELVLKLESEDQAEVEAAKKRIEEIAPKPQLDEEATKKIAALKLNGSGLADETRIAEILIDGEANFTANDRAKLVKFAATHTTAETAEKKEQMIKAVTDKLILKVRSELTKPTEEELMRMIGMSQQHVSDSYYAYVDSQRIEDAVAKTDPSNDICVQVYESGSLQDIGHDVEITHCVRAPYKRMRSAVAKMMAEAAVRGTGSKKNAGIGGGVLN